jgi:hypothetical protein
MQHLSEDDVQRIAAAVIAGMAKPGSLPAAQAANIAAAAARTTVQEMMVKGMAFLDVDMADSKQVGQLKNDLRFVRGLRLRCDRVGATITKTIVSAITYGVIGLLLLGLAFWARGQADPPRPPSMIGK